MARRVSANPLAPNILQRLTGQINPRLIGRLGLSLAIGAGGGGLFFLLGFPLPWMLGAMAAATIAALGGAPLGVPRVFRNVMVAVLGVLLGSQFTPDTFSHAGEWTVGIIGVISSVIAMMVLGSFFLRRIGGYDRVTAFFAATPGGLSEMTLVGEDMGGDPRRISLSHGVRVLTAVFLIAFYFRIFEGYQPTGLPIPQADATAWLDVVLLVGSAVIGYPVAKLIRLPAAQLVGPLAVSAALSFSDVVTATPPAELIAVAQVVLGSAIGARFVGTAIRGLGRPVLMAVAVGLMMVLLAAGFAFGLGALTGAPGAMLFLAFAPGGLAEMSIIALSFDAEPAFVSTHHILRIAILVVVAPLLFRWFLRKFPGAPN